MGEPVYKYAVFITIDMKRIDNQALSDDENAMLLEMHNAAEVAASKVMSEHGMNNTKRIKKEMVAY